MKRFGSMFLCLTAVVAITALSVAPAFAGEDKKEKETEETTVESHQQADQEASETEERNASNRPERTKKTEEAEETTTASSAPAGGSTTTEDPEGKRYDGEGEPRGETASECTNDHDANFSGSGSNHSGPYDSTCDGSASLAGNGGGGAQGRPCAGCVGNADNKNPKGQYNDGNRDGNAGYECDANNGVGRSNPAHTGCKPPVTTSNLCPPGTILAGQLPGPQGCNPPVVQGRTDKVCPPGTEKAGSKMESLKDCDSVLGTIIRRVLPQGGTPPQVRAAATAPAQGAVLPFTGAGDLYFFLALGLLLVALGTVGARLHREDS